MRIPIICPLILGMMFSAAEGAQTVLLKRLIVIDISGSMEGESLDQVRKELVNLLQTQPASPAAPVTFLTFSDDAHPVKQFTKQADAIRFVESLRSDQGGTRIGAALEAAIAELQGNDSLNNVTVMLYTDDQDPDRATIARAEQALGKLFHERSERGLSQAVYIRSWSSGGALGELIVELAKNPDVTVLGSDSPLTVVPVTMQPAVRVDSSRLDDDGTHLEIQFRAACGITGVPQGFGAPPMAFRCLNPSSQPPNEWDIIPVQLPKHVASV